LDLKKIVKVICKRVKQRLHFNDILVRNKESSNKVAHNEVIPVLSSSFHLSGTFSGLVKA